MSNHTVPFCPCIRTAPFSPCGSVVLFPPWGNSENYFFEFSGVTFENSQFLSTLKMLSLLYR